MNRFLTVASALFALAAAAPTVHAESAGQTSVRVAYADLNLGSISGRQALDQRVSRAIDRVCGELPSLADLDSMHQFQSCQKAARSSLDGQLKSVMTTSVADISADVAPGR